MTRLLPSTFRAARDGVDRADQRADSVGRSELQAHGFGRDDRTVGEEVVGDSRQPPLDRAERATHEGRLELVERETVERVNDGGHVYAPRGDPAEGARPPCVCVNEIVITPTWNRFLIGDLEPAKS